MTILEQLECSMSVHVLQQGEKARIRNTDQIVELKCVSEHGVSVVSFRDGCEHFISNRFLEPVYTVH
jgi:hypothetical protein